MAHYSCVNIVAGSEGKLSLLYCSYLRAKIEVSEARLAHITARHPDLLPDNREQLEKTITEPELVRTSGRMIMAKILYRWFDDLLGGKYIAAVVMCETGEPARNWLMTAYITRNIPKGGLEWKKS